MKFVGSLKFIKDVCKYKYLFSNKLSLFQDEGEPSRLTDIGGEDLTADDDISSMVGCQQVGHGALTNQKAPKKRKVDKQKVKSSTQDPAGGKRSRRKDCS